MGSVKFGYTEWNGNGWSDGWGGLGWVRRGGTRCPPTGAQTVFPQLSMSPVVGRVWHGRFLLKA